MFSLELRSNEQLIGTAAAARMANPDQGMEEMIVVGDLDGDGIDDAVVKSYSSIQGGTMYVLYGGSGVTGSIDLASLPVLTATGHRVTMSPPGANIAALGDVDGDGLADFLFSVAGDGVCGGAYLVYGSATRLTGSHAVSEVAALLNIPGPCNVGNFVAGLGDIDGDGKADFTISTQPLVASETAKVFVYYGRGQRLSGTVDLAATADAVIIEPGAKYVYGNGKAFRAGDVDGDGIADFIVRLPVDYQVLDARVVRGSATRLAGTVALGDIGHTQLPSDGYCFWSTEAYVFALGDLDGDGADDFSLVTCHPGTTKVYGPVEHRVFYGRKAGLPAQLEASDAAATLPAVFGPWTSQLLAGDIDGDGVRDLILADQNIHDENGGVRILIGEHERLSGAIDPESAALITYVGQPQRVPKCKGRSSCVVPERIGAGVSLGDLTGDHRQELLIGAATDEYEILPGPGAAMGHTYIVSSPVSSKP
jgi:hypothetical protein